MGFNTHVRKALDERLPTGRRFVALRNAIQRFSPNGFNATFENLERAVGVSDSDSWTAAEIERAAELLRESRALYLRHRELWDQGRRRRKVGGVQSPSSEELAALNDRSWFDEVSYAVRGRYRWGGLADWVEANGLSPGPFGPDMEADVQQVFGESLPAPFNQPRSMLAHHGPFSIPGLAEPATVIEIPYRVRDAPITSSAYSSLSTRQRLLADCWYSRSLDGHVRERHIERIIPAEEYWVIPYVIAALGDYVIEIVQKVERFLTSLRGTWHDTAYRDFAKHNHDFMWLVRQQATSYHRCYYTATHSRAGLNKPLYPAFSVIDRLTGAGIYPHRYRLPRE